MDNRERPRGRASGRVGDRSRSRSRSGSGARSDASRYSRTSHVSMLAKNVWPHNTRVLCQCGGETGTFFSLVVLFGLGILFGITLFAY